MRVMVLGCGPSGLLAAHAAAQVFGRGSVEVFSNRPRKSPIFGCQYLHGEIEGLDCGQPQKVRWEVWGDPNDYAAKVYGSLPPNAMPMHTSVDEYGWAEPHTAWNLRRAYSQLWAEWGARVHDTGVLGYHDVKRMFRAISPDLVLSTIPAADICGNTHGHYFLREQVWAIGDAPELEVYSPFRPPPFTVVCNAEKAPRWYRAANVFDYVTCEWPFAPKPPLPGVAQVTKPLKTNCDCLAELLPGKVFSLGRYGRWQKGYLTHQTFADATKVCASVRDNGIQEVLDVG